MSVSAGCRFCPFCDQRNSHGTPRTAQHEGREILTLIRGLLQDTRRGEIIRSGIRLAIFGPPNAGKSSLLNFLGMELISLLFPISGASPSLGMGILWGNHDVEQVSAKPLS